jgi:hypothetical protein
MITASRDVIDQYFSKVHVTKESMLSEEQIAGRLLDRIAQDITGISTQVQFTNYQSYDDAEKRQINFKLEKKTVIMQEDYEKIPELRDLRDTISYLKEKINEIDDENTQNKLKSWIANLRTNQKLIKEMVLKPIDFKKLPLECHEDQYELGANEELWQDFYPYEENIKYDVDLLTSKGWEGILRLLPFQNVEGQLVKKFLQIFDTICPLCSFTNDENRVLRTLKNPKKDHEKKLDRDDYKIYKRCFLTNDDIAKRLEMDNKTVHYFMNSIATKLRDQYEKYFIEQWYYVFYVRGKYKVCKQCGKTKLVLDFANDSSYADGKKSICKECFNSNYKICPKCCKKLNKKMFGVDNRNFDGLQTYCKNCRKQL